jgi:hypothetical protein
MCALARSSKSRGFIACASKTLYESGAGNRQPAGIAGYETSLPALSCFANLQTAKCAYLLH